MKKRLMAGLCVAAAAALMATGCCWTQRGAAIGGALGAGVGAIAEGGEGALVGLAAGGLAGALIGDQFDHKKMGDLEAEIDRLKRELEAKEAALAAKDKEIADLKNRIKELEDQLKQRDKEIADLRRQLGELTKVKPEGKEIIVTTLLAETHYRPGKAELTPAGMAELDRVVGIIKKQFPDRKIAVRGHTDSDPIKYSGWKSNWELGAARALGALHYLMDKHGIQGENINAATFSKYQPVADNATAEGKQLNRRVEIVILPKQEPTVERMAPKVDPAAAKRAAESALRPAAAPAPAPKPAAPAPAAKPAAKTGAKKAGTKAAAK